MRIKGIKLSWFRGAADPVSLESNGKSMVVYGANGSGKSSFVDAIEYAIKDKIGHLTHEYSGRRQEKGILNTHTPANQKADIAITLTNNALFNVEIQRDGSSTSSGAAATQIKNWHYQRIVLRQDDVSNFIHMKKAEKYSVLLPLLGLESLEVAAENLRQLAKMVEDRSELASKTSSVKTAKDERIKVFGELEDDQLNEKIMDLYKSYTGSSGKVKEPPILCEELISILQEKLKHSTGEHISFNTLKSISDLALETHIEKIRGLNSSLASAGELFINEKLGILETAEAYADGLRKEEDVKCPACGQMIPTSSFKTHIETEKVRLQGLIQKYTERKSGINKLCNDVGLLKSNIQKVEIKPWYEEWSKDKEKASALSSLVDIDLTKIRESCDESHLRLIEDRFSPLIDLAKQASGSAPPEAEQLASDIKSVETAIKVYSAQQTIDEIDKISWLISFLQTMESTIRSEITQRTTNIIDSISGDIQTMWSLLHPGEAINDIKLYVPGDGQKAIDIGLTFHGVEQDSPRLSLSEGHRNSLGLCIFLAMAKKESENDRPLILDDVVISLDRNHRGMIAQLLQSQFVDRQILLFTHDRVWYAELRRQLDVQNWTFSTLLPWENPELGIRWSHRTTLFDDARSHLPERPDSAGNDARKIMDIELPLWAEILKLRLPFMRGEANDRRTAYDFLIRLIADGKKCFERKVGEGYQIYQDALDKIDQAHRLLATWGNRASHTQDIVPAEAEALIDACEGALQLFTCSSCGGAIRLHNENSKWVQCSCGELRWRYGKV